MINENNESVIYREISEMALNWYRDENGLDLYENEGVSIGQLISSAAIVFFASIYREYYWFKKNYNVTEPIVYNNNEHPIRLLIAQRLSTNFRTDRSVPASGDVLDRQHGAVPAYRKASNYLAYLQLPILPFLKRKRTLYLADWTYSTLEKNNTEENLFVNSTNIIKGAYLRSSAKYKSSSEKFMPQQLDEAKVRQSLFSYSQKMILTLPEELISLFCDYIIIYYNQNRDFFVTTIALYEELMVRYQPTSVVFPGELYEPYMLIRTICERRGIKTVFMLDGFPLYVYYPQLKDRNGSRYCFNRFVAYGQGNEKDYLSKKIPLENINMRRWPVFDRYDNSEFVEGIYDCIIMTWIPNNNNPNARLDKQSEILHDVLALVKSKGYSRIAIKIKAAMEKKYVLTLLGNEPRIDLLEGPLYKHLRKAKMVIGGVSSAVAEARYCDIPYFIYEPLHNGYPDSLLFNSSVLSRNIVARDIEQLNNNIDTKMSIMNIDKSFIIHDTPKRHA